VLLCIICGALNWADVFSWSVDRTYTGHGACTPDKGLSSLLFARLAVVDVDESESAESFELPARKTVALPSFWSRCCHLEESCDTLVTPSESSNTLATQSQQGLCS
jgi:hypothetical protein